MKRFILRLVLILSLVFNIVTILVFILLSLPEKDKDKMENPEYRTTRAQNLMRAITVNRLCFPESYDPIYTIVDSAFHGPLTDSECRKAAIELIKLKAELPSAERKFKEASHNLKIFGSSGVFWHHAEDKKNAEEYLNSLKLAITKCEEIIKLRDTSMDGEFIGWQIKHRFRAKTSDKVLIIEELYVVNPEMTNWMFHYGLNNFDDDNLKRIENVINHTLALGIRYDK